MTSWWHRTIITGTLHQTPLGYVLQVADGWVWHLDISDMDAGGLIGRPIIVDATRSGFNLLDVHRIASKEDWWNHFGSPRR